MVKIGYQYLCGNHTDEAINFMFKDQKTEMIESLNLDEVLTNIVSGNLDLGFIPISNNQGLFYNIDLHQLEKYDVFMTVKKL